MDCPECGGRLVDYRLGDRDAVGCEDCGYVGIDAEHRGRPTERESWDDALDRFYHRRAASAANEGERTDDGVAGRAETSGDEAAPTDGAVDGDATDGDGIPEGDETENGEPPGSGVDRERPAAVNGSVERAPEDGDDA